MRESTSSRVLVPRLYFISWLQHLLNYGDDGWGHTSYGQAPYWILKLERVLCWYNMFKSRFCIAGGSSGWKGLKCNAFEMKWKGAKEWNMTCWLLMPGVLGVTSWDSAMCVCVCFMLLCIGRVCNVMQAAFAPVTSYSTLMFRPDGD